MEKKKSNTIALAITIIFTIIVIWNVDFSELIRLCSLMNKKFIPPYLLIFVSVMFVRTIRWRILLPKTDGKLIDLYELYMTANFLNIFLPARAGDFFRGIFLGQKYKVSKLCMLGTVLAERILDGLSVICLLTLGIVIHYRSQFVLNILFVAIVLFVGSFIFMLWVYKYKKIDYICEKMKNFASLMPAQIAEKAVIIIEKCQPHLNSFMEGFETFTNIKTMAKAACYSAITWSCDCFLVYFIMLAFGIETHFTVALFVVSFIALSTIIPQSTIYIGLYQGAFILAAKMFGISKTMALSVALTQQMLMIAVYSIFALVFIWKNQLKMSDLKGEQNSNNG